MEQQLDFSHFSQNDKFEIGNRIHDLRKQNKMTLEQLSYSTGIDPRAISRHENGGMFETETLVKYSLALGCTVEDLFPIRIAAQINGKSEEAQRHWNMLMGLNDEQKQAVYHMISVLAAKTV